MEYGVFKRVKRKDKWEKAEAEDERERKAGNNNTVP